MPWLSKQVLMSARAKVSPFQEYRADSKSGTLSFCNVVVLCLKSEAEAGCALREQVVHNNESFISNTSGVHCVTR